MLADVEAGHVTAVIAWHPDRLYRRPLDLEHLVTVAERHGVQLSTCKAGEVDLNTPSGRMNGSHLRGRGARRGRATRRAEQSRAGKREAQARGGYTGGTRPFGYRVVPVAERHDGRPLAIIQAEAEAVRHVASVLLTGGSLRAAARQVSERGVRTVKGTVFSGSALRKVLLRPTTAALAVIDGAEVPAQWDPLLNLDTWRAVGAILRDPTRRTTVAYERRWLLSGIAVCGATLPDGTSCGVPLTANTTAGGGPGARRAAYRCRAALAATTGGSAHVVRDAAALDKYVRDVTVARLSRRDAAALLAPPARDLAPLRADRERLLTKRSEDLALRRAGAYDAAEFLAISRDFRERLARVDKDLADAQSGDVLAGLVGVADVAEVWDGKPDAGQPGLSLERRRAVVAALWSVTVLPRERRGRLPAGQRLDLSAVRVESR